MKLSLGCSFFLPSCLAVSVVLCLELIACCMSSCIADLLSCFGLVSLEAKQSSRHLVSLPRWVLTEFCV